MGRFWNMLTGRQTGDANETFKRTKIYRDESDWDGVTCPECGRQDLLRLSDTLKSSPTTRTKTETVLIRDDGGDEIGSLEFQREVAATNYESKKLYMCAFCLERWYFTEWETQ